MSKVTPAVAVVGFVVGAFLLNYGLVQLGHKPYLYCGFRDMVWGMYVPMQVLISLTGIIGLAVFIALKRFGYAFLSAMVTVFAYLGPEWTRILFSVGKDCT